MVIVDCQERELTVKNAGKSIFLFILALFVVLVLSVIITTPQLSAATNKDFEKISSLTDRATDEIQSTTGMALSPGLILFIKGGLNYLRAEKKETLPWHSRWEFLLPLGGLLLLFFIKDFIPFEPLQKFLAAIEEGTMTLFGILGFLTVIPGLSNILTPVIQSALNTVGPLFSTSQALAAVPGSGLGQDMVSGLSEILATVSGAAIFVAVWIVSNTVNVLCLVAPGLAAPVLKGLRLSVVSALTALGLAHPFLGLLAALAIIIISLILFRWSLRLTIWGALFSFDLIFRRWRIAETQTSASGVQAFAGAMAVKYLKIPKRTLGQLRLEGNQLFFYYRRFLLFKRVVPVYGPYFVCRTLTSPILAIIGPTNRFQELFFFRLKTKSHENELVKTIGAQVGGDFGLLKSSQKAWSWLSGLFSRKNQELTVA
ncbi:MAG: hypothetical protein LBS44_00320 [Deltaproteobacteria bacterium]|jgi:hypothetical protein|nr:hypothetical protein [Deltaproteobacteria bacterium]